MTAILAVRRIRHEPITLLVRTKMKSPVDEGHDGLAPAKAQHAKQASADQHSEPRMEYRDAETINARDSG